MLNQTVAAWYAAYLATSIKKGSTQASDAVFGRKQEDRTSEKRAISDHTVQLTCSIARVTIAAADEKTQYQSISAE